MKEEMVEHYSDDDPLRGCGLWAVLVTFVLVLAFVIMYLHMRG